jgi:hypothetical protein
VLLPREIDNKTNYYYSQSYVEQLKEKLWNWNGGLYLNSIPLNFYDTSVNKGPLRANLYEHPQEAAFYKDPWPNASYFADLSRAHVVEADLLEFIDILFSIDGNHLILKGSKINARIIGEIDSGWEIGKPVYVKYLDEGIYELSNKSESIKNHAYLSDAGYSDLRKFNIYPTLPEYQN